MKISKSTPKGNIVLEMTSRQIWEEFRIDIDDIMTISDIRKVFSNYRILTSTKMTEYGFPNTIFIEDRWTNQLVRKYEFDGGFECNLDTINKIDFTNALYAPTK